MPGRVAFALTLLLTPALAGCASLSRPAALAPAAVVELVEDLVPLEWRNVATPRDLQRLEAMDESWRQALSAARRFRTALSQEGPLLDPGAALPRAAPTPGPYLCRVVKLGARPAFIAFRPFYCFVDAEGELLTMVKASGSQRPAGRLWADGDSRMIFLGAMARGGEDAPAYGEDEARDVAGILERIDPFRWRLVVPVPGDGAVLDVYELVPSVPLEP